MKLLVRFLKKNRPSTECVCVCVCVCMKKERLIDFQELAHTTVKAWQVQILLVG